MSTASAEAATSASAGADAFKPRLVCRHLPRIIRAGLTVLACCFFVVLSVLPTARAADGPTDQFVRIYRNIQDADRFVSLGQKAKAAGLYRTALKDLTALKAANPDWNEKVVKYRLDYLNEKLTELKDEVKELPSAEPAAAPGAAPTSAPTPAPTPTDTRVRDLQEQVRQLEADRRVLDAKLKEALSAQPAVQDPQELARARERVRSLEKEKELLQVALKSTRQPAPSKAPDAELQEAQRALQAAQRRIAEQEKQIRDLKLPAAQAAKSADRKPDSRGEATPAEATSPSENPLSRQVEDLQRELRQAQANLASQQAANERLLAENRQLQDQMKQVQKTLEEKEKRESKLQRQLLDVQQKLARRQARGTPDTNRVEQLLQEQKRLLDELAEAKSQANKSREQLAALQRERTEIGEKLQQNLGDSSRAKSSEVERIRSLEKERDELRRQLAQASRKSNKEAKKRGDDREKEVEMLRARVSALEAKAAPYSAEELALFEKPQSTPPSAPVVVPTSTAENPPAAKPSSLPTSAGPLIAEAERAYAAKRYPEAEQRYQEVLKLDSQNVRVLANLAATQLEQQRYDEAERNLKQALAEAPQDAGCLSLLGVVKFRQHKVDEALEALSLSAKLDDKNPETQNFLGVALSEKGLRGPAEAALRKAIQLSPGYGSAHHNLAVIYATQKPGFPQLAKWHYLKAINAGHPRNPDLEKIIGN